MKSNTIVAPNSVWCAIALAIAEDRKKDSNLFIEDTGDSIPADSKKARDAFLYTLMEKIAKSIVHCGDDSNVKYKGIYVGYKTEWIPEGYVGCSLTCAPLHRPHKKCHSKVRPRIDTHHDYLRVGKADRAVRRSDDFFKLLRSYDLKNSLN